MTAAELKASILDRAVRGLLVPQDPNDEPAAKPSHIDNPPYELPRGWVWVRLGELGSTINGLWKGVKKPFINIAVIRAANFTRDCELKLENLVYIDVETTKYEKRKLLPGDIIIERSGGGENQPVGRAVLFDHTEGEFSFCNFTSILRIKNNTVVFPRYLQQALTALYATGYTAKIQSNTTGLRNLDFKAYLETPIPLPPLAEQKRIVAKIEELMPLVEEYGKAETELAALNLGFPTALRKSILQHAVEGRLTAAWRTSQTSQTSQSAAKLLAKIAAEKKHLLASGKIKKQKPLPPITDDEKPFPIPDGWEWVRLGEIGTWGSGATPSKSNNAYYKNGTIPWLVTGDLNDGNITEIPGTITPLALEETSVKLNQPESVLIAMYGATIGKVGILKIAATTNQACCACQPFGGIYNKFLFYYLMSQRDTFQKRGEGGAQPNISKEKIVATLFPLPPLAEQKAIVARVEELLALVEKMKE